MTAGELVARAVTGPDEDLDLRAAAAGKAFALNVTLIRYGSGARTYPVLDPRWGWTVEVR